tara:strand:+ start:697 stop:1296 length:600 start_codon:yes stop_codon:yes gene_type:complete
MNIKQVLVKRSFDFTLSVIGLAVASPIIILSWLVASVETRSNGLFFQKRVGRNKKIFILVKIKTMKPVLGINTNVTKSNDARITKSGALFRNAKIDELPQLWNVLLGQMSFVGPRPDVEGYADRLIGTDNLILSVRPGITGPASLKYKNEEDLLMKQVNPEQYNNDVIWPDKVQINIEYVNNWSFIKDLNYIYQTVKGV